MKKELFKKDIRGAVRYWVITWGDNWYRVRHGLIDGELQEENYDVSEGKQNRTIQEQVELIVNRKIENKKRSGYVDSIGDIENSNKNTLGLYRPMKARLLRDGSEPPVEVFNGKAYVQRKYNGHRCIITRQNDKVIAYSSGGKPITSIDHILKDIVIKEGQHLDGELYKHGLSLQAISSRVRKQKVTAEDIEFVIFDQIMDAHFKKRYDEIPDQKSFYIVKAWTKRVKTFTDVRSLFRGFKEEGYEGAMLRHGKFSYEAGRRSQQIFKIKKLDGMGYYDEEFRVVGVTASQEGWAILHCKTAHGNIFKVSAPGTHSEKRHVLFNIEDYVGKKVMVEFPEWTDSGKPSQPVALMWRDKNEE